MASVVTLSDMRTQARERADMVNSNFISTSELTDYINEASLELYDLMVQKFGDEYYHTYSQISIGSSSNIYALPKDFYKLKGVEVPSDEQNGRYISLLPYMFNERNRYTYNASNLPTRNVRIRYVPRAKRLSDTSQTFVDADVSVANDTITEADHQMSSGEEITFTTTTTLPVPIAVGTTYFVIRSTDDVFSIATTKQNAFDETALTITSAASGGTHTIVEKRDRADWYNGYEAYIIWRTVEMMKEKEESDTQVARDHVQRQEARIISAAGHRDAGLPQRITDINNMNDLEQLIYQENNVRYRIIGNNIEFIYIGFLGI